MCEECNERIEKLETGLDCALEAIDELQQYARRPRGAAYTDHSGEPTHQHLILWGPGFSPTGVVAEALARQPQEVAP